MASFGERGGLRGTLWLVALGAVGAVLDGAGARAAEISAALGDPQAYVDAAGADGFLLALATAAGWLALAWTALGSGLVALASAPGLLGHLGARLSRLLIPVTMRRFLAIAVGLAVLGGTAVADARPDTRTSMVSLDWPGPVQELGVPDWPPVPVPAPSDPGAPAEPAPPTTPPPAPDPSPAPVPDPSPTPTPPLPDPAPAPPPETSPPPADYLVQPGDCLWDIAERELAAAGAPIDVATVNAAVLAWWRANADRITDPDVIYPGQVLTAPAAAP